MEMARQTARLRIHHQHETSHESRTNEFNRQIGLVRSQGFSPHEESFRIRNLEKGFGMVAQEKESSEAQIAVAEAPRKKIKLPRNGTIFHRH